MRCDSEAEIQHHLLQDSDRRGEGWGHRTLLQESTQVTTANTADGAAWTV